MQGRALAAEADRDRLHRATKAKLEDESERVLWLREQLGHAQAPYVEAIRGLTEHADSLQQQAVSFELERQTYKSTVSELTSKIAILEKASGSEISSPQSPKFAVLESRIAELTGALGKAISKDKELRETLALLEDEKMVAESKTSAAELALEGVREEAKALAEELATARAASSRNQSGKGGEQAGDLSELTKKLNDVTAELEEKSVRHTEQLQELELKHLEDMSKLDQELSAGIERLALVHAQKIEQLESSSEYAVSRAIDDIQAS